MPFKRGAILEKVGGGPGPGGIGPRWIRSPWRRSLPDPRPFFFFFNLVRFFVELCWWFGRFSQENCEKKKCGVHSQPPAKFWTVQRRRGPGKRREVLKVQRRGPGDVQGVGVVGPGRRSRKGGPETHGPNLQKRLGF